MDRPIVKYLDPISGQYEFATVIDIGDLTRLNTTVKTNIVDAINSIMIDGIIGGNAELTEEDAQKLENIKRSFEELKNGTFQITNLGSVNNYFTEKFDDLVDRINRENIQRFDTSMINVEQRVDEAIERYEQMVAEKNNAVEAANNAISDATEKLNAKARELETANIGFESMREEVNESLLKFSSQIESIDFDTFNGMTEDYKTLKEQTRLGFGEEASKSTLSYLNGRVTDAHAKIETQADEISQKVSYEQMQYLPIKKSDGQENLLFNTIDFSDNWNFRTNAVTKTNKEFQYGKVVEFVNQTALLSTISDEINVGETYTLTTYFNVQNLENGVNQAFKPQNTFDNNNFRITVDGQNIPFEIYEDLSGINGWVRVKAQFVATDKNADITFSSVGVTNGKVGYMAQPKLEQGEKVGNFQPHTNDELATLLSQQSEIKQQGDSILLIANGVKQFEDRVETMSSDLKVATDGVTAHAQRLTNIEGKVIGEGSELSVLSNKISNKVWSEDVNNAIGDINIDNRNRVLNSDFFRNGVDERSRALTVEDWSLSTGWTLNKRGNQHWIKRERTGLTAVNTTSVSTNYFGARTGERLSFNFEAIHSNLDNDTVFVIELFNISNVRQLKKEYRLSELTKTNTDTPNAFKYSGILRVDMPNVEKGKITLQLPKNGTIEFTKIMLQNSDIASTDWSPAPEDSWVVRTKTESEIQILKDGINLISNDTRLDRLSGLLTERDGVFDLSPEKILAQVTHKSLGDNIVVTQSALSLTDQQIRAELVGKDGIIQAINATEEELLIDFDKVRFTGATLAQYLDVAKGFRVKNGDGATVLGADDSGNVVMNVSKLSINAQPVATESSVNERVKNLATKEQLENIQLTPGPRGTSVQSVKNYYLATNQANGVTRSTSGWSLDVSSQQISATKQYLWNYEQTMFDNGTTNNTTPTIIGYWGRDGVSGTSGRGIRAITEYYLLNNAITGVTHSTSGWSTTTKVPTQANKYVWNYEKIEYTDGSTPTLTTPRIIAMFGEKGETGRDGIGINTVTNYYKLTNSTTTPSHTDSGWVTTPPTTSATNRYLWNYEKITYSSGEPTNTPVAMIGVHGVDGARGANGSDGRSITSVDEYYLASGASSGITRSTTGWTTTVQNPTDAKPYLWNYEKINFSSGNPSYTEPILIGYKARDGRNGTDGVAGRDGVGIRSTEITYGLSTSDTTQPTTWSAQVPTLVKGQYLWTKTVWTYTNSTTETGYVKTYIARDGNNGTNGVAGKDGVGIRSTTITYASSTSGTTQPTSGWQSQVPNVPNGQYLWTKTVWTYTDNTNETGYSVARMGADGAKGAKGDKGDPGTSINNIQEEYYLSTSKTTQTGGSWITTPPQWEIGKYIWTRSKITYSSGNPTYTTPLVSSEWEAVNNISIGGTNLLQRNNFGEYRGGNIVETTKIEELNYKYTIKEQIFDLVGFSTELNKDERELTISCFSNLDNVIAYYKFNNSEQKNIRLKKTNSRFHITINIPEGATSINVGLGRYPHIAPYSGYYIDKPQAEYGNIPTNWSPTPEDVQSNIDNITVGGRNLIKNSNNIMLNGSDNGNNRISKNDDRYIATPQNSGNIYNTSVYPSQELIKGEQYTLSFEVKTNNNMKAYWYAKQNNFASINIESKNNTWQKVIYTYIQERDSFNEKFLWGFHLFPAGTIIEYKNLKLEKGNKATDWSPAPEDVQTQIDTSVKATDVEYYLSTSTTSLSGGSWQTTAPQWVQGKYMWSRTKVTFNNGQTQYRPSANGVCIAGAKGDTGERGLQGLQGPQGNQGIQGAKGADGQSSYTHVAYANNATGTSGFSLSDANREYIGIYVDNNPTSSSTPSKYKWTLIKGRDGSNGLPGAKGADGRTPYFHTAYANSSDGRTDFSTTNSDKKRYIGTYTDYTQADSTDPTRYKWVDMVGSIEVGGRNLLENSSMIFNYDKWSPQSQFHQRNGYVEVNGEIGVTKHLSQGILDKIISDGIDTTYTLSVDINVSNIASGTTNYYLEVYVDGRAKDNRWIGANYIHRPTLSTYQNQGWIRYYATFKISEPRENIAHLNFFMFARDFTGNLKFKNIKLEKGNTPTDWSPAPEDVQYQIDTMKIGGDNYFDIDNFHMHSPYLSELNRNGNSITFKMLTNSSTNIGKYITLQVRDFQPTNEEWVVSGYIKIKGVIPTTTPFTNANQRASTYANDGKFYYDNRTGYFYLTQVYNDNGSGSSWILHTALNANNGDLIELRDIKFEKGNKPTSWSEYYKKAENELTESLETTKTELSKFVGRIVNIQELLDTKLSSDTHEEFVKTFQESNQQLLDDLQGADKKIEGLLQRATTIENTLGSGAEEWIFNNTNIKMADEGILIGDKSQGSYVLVSSSQIAFYNGNQEPVATISGGMLNINHAVFVESIKIKDYQVTSEQKGHITFRYVGK